MNTNEKNKNPLLACALSAIIPGTGHFYTGNYKRGAIYLSIELFSWAYRSHYQDKGDYYVDRYKDYADKHWSFDKWIRDLTVFADDTHPVYNTMTNSNSDFVYPWTNAHQLEFVLNGINIGTSETHGIWFRDNYIEACPDLEGNQSENYSRDFECDTEEFDGAEVLKDHHFHEGISKYDMFFAGWDDTHDCDQLIIDEHGDCSWSFESNKTVVPMSVNKLYYQYELRNKANKHYDQAENALTLIFINHAISFFDSFITNFIKNNNLNFNYYTSPIYDYNPELKLKGVNISILW